MKSAKEMFEELDLNYHKVNDRTKGKIIYCVKAKCIPDRLNTEYINFKKITFALNGFKIESWQTDPLLNRIKTFDDTFITYDELKAINKQVEEIVGGELIC